MFALVHQEERDRCRNRHTSFPKRAKYLATADQQELLMLRDGVPTFDDSEMRSDLDDVFEIGVRLLAS